MQTPAGGPAGVDLLSGTYDVPLTGNGMEQGPKRKKSLFLALLGFTLNSFALQCTTGGALGNPG